MRGKKDLDRQVFRHHDRLNNQRQRRVAAWKWKPRGIKNCCRHRRRCVHTEAQPTVLSQMCTFPWSATQPCRLLEKARRIANLEPSKGELVHDVRYELREQQQLGQSQRHIAGKCGGRG